MKREHSEARTIAMAAAFRAGKTMQEIANVYGISRERVRQCLKQLGLAGSDGGAHVNHVKRTQSRQAQLEAACLRRYGVSRAERDANAHLVPAFRNQKHSASMRGIAWQLTFGQWLQVWQDSGRLSERGRGSSGYCMARIGDNGPYAIGNVVIKTNAENASECRVLDAFRQPKQFPGVFCLYPGTARPYVAKYGKKMVGRYATQEEAAEAHAAYRREHGLIAGGLGTGKGWTIHPGAKSRPYQMQCAGMHSFHATQEEAEAAYRAAVARILEQRAA